MKTVQLTNICFQTSVSICGSSFWTKDSRHLIIRTCSISCFWVNSLALRLLIMIASSLFCFLYPFSFASDLCSCSVTSSTSYINVSIIVFLSFFVGFELFLIWSIVSYTESSGTTKEFPMLVLYWQRDDWHCTWNSTHFKPFRGNACKDQSGRVLDFKGIDLVK